VLLLFGVYPTLKGLAKLGIFRILGIPHFLPSSFPLPRRAQGGPSIIPGGSFPQPGGIAPNLFYPIRVSLATWEGPFLLLGGGILTFVGKLPLVESLRAFFFSPREHSSLFDTRCVVLSHEQGVFFRGTHFCRTLRDVLCKSTLFRVLNTHQRLRGL